MLKIFLLNAFIVIGTMTQPSPKTDQCRVKDSDLFRVLNSTEYSSQGKDLTKFWIFVKPKHLTLQNVIAIVTSIQEECGKKNYLRINVYDQKDTSIKDPLRPADPDVVASDPVRAYYTFERTSGINELLFVEKDSRGEFTVEVKFTSNGYCMTRTKLDPNIITNEK